MPSDLTRQARLAVRGVYVVGLVAQLHTRARHALKRDPSAWSAVEQTLRAMANQVADRDVILALPDSTIGSHLLRVRGLWPERGDDAPPSASLRSTLERAEILLEELVDGVAEELAREEAARPKAPGEVVLRGIAGGGVSITTPNPGPPPTWSGEVADA